MSYLPLTDEEETTSTPRGLTPRGAAHARRPSLRRGVSWSLDSHPGSSLQAPPAPAPSREGEVMPVKIECRSVSYFVGRARAETRIMRDVSCAFFPGEVVALMGPSGAGKTTLLNIAACRAAGRVVGDVLINETRASARVFRAIANFVPQDERLMESLSARATLEYIARLRLPASTPRAATRAHLDGILATLGLDACADVVVGGAMAKGLSGGQKKRLSIAMELVNQPSVLFLDEPTSGLDSRTAGSVVRAVRAIARDAGLTVVTTIHQPPAEVFLSFDRLLLLERGAVVFSGAAGRAAAYFDAQGFPLPPGANPADWMFEVLGREQERAAAASRPPQHAADDRAADDDGGEGGGGAPKYDAAVDGFAARWAREVEREGGPRDDAAARGRPRGEAWPLPSLESRYETAQARACLVVFERSLVCKLRDPGGARKDWTLSVFVGCLYGLVFRAVPNTQEKYNTVLSALFMATVFSGLVTVSLSIIKVPLEKALILREYTNGYYALWAWFFGNLAATLLVQAVATTAFSIPYYLLIGLAGDYLWMLGSFLLLACQGQAFGLLLGVFARDAQAAQAILIPAMMPMIIFCGFLLQRHDVQPYFIEFWYISFFRYGFAPLVVNEFRYGHFEQCDSPGAHCPLGTEPIEMPRSEVLSKNVLNIPLEAVPRFAYIQLGYFGITLLVTYYSMRYQARKKYG